MSKKILVISNSVRSLVLLRFQLLKDFVKHGYEVVACASFDDKGGDSKYSAVLSKIGIRFVPIKLNNTSLNPIHDAVSFFMFIMLIRKEEPDVVLNYMIKPVIYGSLAAKCSKVPNIYSVITGLGYVFIGENFKIRALRFIVKKLYKISLKFNKKIFFQNSDDLNLFVNSHLLLKNKTVLINGSGVDINKYSLSTAPNVCTFLLIARLIKDKGIFEYINAARQLKQRYPDTKFLLAGDIDSNPTALTSEELQAVVEEDIVEYLGWVDDVGKVLARSSVFVLPSYREGTPKAVLEAMAAGRPIITTNAPGCRETVKDGVNGYLISIKSVDQLIIAMEKFILFPELIVKMGKESRLIAEERYDIYKVNKSILQAMNLNF